MSKSQATEQPSNPDKTQDVADTQSTEKQSVESASTKTALEENIDAIAKRMPIASPYQQVAATGLKLGANMSAMKAANDALDNGDSSATSGPEFEDGSSIAGTVKGTLRYQTPIGEWLTKQSVKHSLDDGEVEAGGGDVDAIVEEKFSEQKAQWLEGQGLGAMASSGMATAHAPQMQVADEQSQGIIANHTGPYVGGDYTPAQAMALLTLPDAKSSANNDGGDVYRDVRSQIIADEWPGEGHFASCDGAVMTAVRWSGADPDFPIISTTKQYEHMQNSDKWEQVEFNGDVDTLESGDVVANSGNHILMYLGRDTIDEVWGSTPHDTDAVIGSASCNDRSPGLAQEDEIHRMMDKYDDTAVFRYVGEPEKDHPYAKIATTKTPGVNSEPDLHNSPSCDSGFGY